MKQVLFGLLVAFLLAGIIPATAAIDFTSIDISLLRYDPFPAQHGEYLRVWINIENTDIEKAENLIIILEPEYPFSLDLNENATRIIKTLGGIDNTIIDYKIRVAAGAVEGENELKLKYSVDGTEVWMKKNLDINVQTLDANLIITGVESKEVSPGGTTNLKIKIKNDADSYLRDVNIKLNLSGLSFMPVNLTEEKRIYLMNGREEKTIEFNLLVSPDTTCGPYKIPVTSTYYDSRGEKYTKENYITLIVSADPEISISIEEPEILSNGQTGTITLNIINRGLTKAKYLTIILEKGEYEILSLPEIYIGNLDVDDYDSAEFKIYADSDKKEMPLNIKLSYRDDNNRVYSEKYTVNLKLYNQAELEKYKLVPAQDNTFIIILIVIVLIIGYLFYKRKKKK
ncbi:MAG: COG1361 S-layer family protein [Candidatus Aenigmarchaeota archaeon]|nr:COG1361 S-layer family protein [Candidatus Aenigmarchaeota archaeon]